MKIEKMRYEIPFQWQFDHAMEVLEYAARNCYQSYDKMKPGSGDRLLKNITLKEHNEILYHHQLTVRVIADRGCIDELTRHKTAAHAVESTRYCDYSGEMVFIEPLEEEGYGGYSTRWLLMLEAAEKNYAYYKEYSGKDRARGVLPLDIRSSNVITANIASWRNLFKKRCTKQAHPHIRHLMTQIRDDFAERLPVLFGDLI